MAPLGDCFVLLLQTGSPAEKFGEAAKTYANNPTAFHLRAMNMLYEGLKKENATIVIVPSTAVETMELGGLARVTALTASLSQKTTPKPAVGPLSGTPSPDPRFGTIMP